MIGQTLSHYRITAALGAGGMGEVYRATDTTLKRDVAIKVLPPEVTQDPERLARFRREAHLLAALNHPNVAAIYGLEEAAGEPFLVLELVEGEDLRRRLARGAIPTDETIEIARQIAEGLEAAHEKGIVHRDLKPGNVKLTPDGKIKVLDFGLAKAWAGDAEGSTSSASMSQSPTLAHSGTAAGIILGTAAYMSPEQARGKPVDKRADVWSFGVLLWEMLTGRPLFSGDTVTDVIAAVVTKEPDLDALPAETPGPVRRLLSRCLRKDPRRRLPDIGGARLEIEDALSGAAGEDAAHAPTDVAEGGGRPRRTRERMAWGLALLLAMGVAGAALWTRSEGRPARVVQSTLSPPPGTSFSISHGWREHAGSLVVSPDGRHIAFAVEDDGETTLWVHPLDSSEARPLPGTEDATWPFWSPDSRFVAFFARGKLRRVAVDGGPPIAICDAARGARPGDWNEEDVILFSPASFSGIQRVPASGGTPEPVTTISAKNDESTHRYPIFLPGGRRFLYVSASHGRPATEEAAAVWVASLDSDERTFVLEAQSNVVYAAGHLLFVREDTLLAQAFDPSTLELRGDPVPIATEVCRYPLAFRSVFSASRNGVLAYAKGPGHAVLKEVVLFDRRGKETAVLPGADQYSQFRRFTLSPDGGRVAIDVANSETDLSDLWILDVDRGTRSRFTFEKGFDWLPVWSRDGRRLAWTHIGPGGNGWEVRVRDVEGTSDPVTRFGGKPGQIARATDWTPDGKLIAVTATHLTDDRGIWLVPAEDDGTEPAPLIDNPEVDEWDLTFSPDGKWVAYTSDESGRRELYVASYPDLKARRQVSESGAMAGIWTSNMEIVYRTYPDPLRFLSVAVHDTGSSLELSEPVELFSVPDAWGAALPADGETFVVVRPVEKERARARRSTEAVRLVINWDRLLEEPGR